MHTVGMQPRVPHPPAASLYRFVTSLGIEDLVRAGLFQSASPTSTPDHSTGRKLTLPQDPQVLDPSLMEALHLGQEVCMLACLVSLRGEDEAVGTVGAVVWWRWWAGCGVVLCGESLLKRGGGVDKY